jgi:hypothetical protein
MAKPRKARATLERRRAAAASTTADPIQYGSPLPTTETQESAQKRIAELDDLHEKAEDTIDDLHGVLEREYQYHCLRAEELERELLRLGIEV